MYVRRDVRCGSARMRALVGYQSAEVLNLDSSGSDNAVEMEPMEKFGTGSQRDNSPLVPPVPLHRQERRPQCRSVRTEWIPDGHRGPHQRCTKGLFAR